MKYLIIILSFLYTHTLFSQAYDPYDETADLGSMEDKYATSDFKGHWQGIEVGLTNYLTADHSTSIPARYKYMKLNSLRSWGFNLNLLQQSVGLIGDQFGVIGGVGFEFSNYRFAEDTTSITYMNDSITPVSGDFNKSKLTTSYLTVPLLIEFQFPRSSRRADRLHVMAGVIGGLKLGTHTKTLSKDGNKRDIEKGRENFHISQLRYGYTFRIGFKRFNIYANYYATPLFEKGDGPELYPVSIGLRFGI